MGQTRINPRLLMVAAAGALIVALLSLAIHSLVVSALGWLAFEMLAILTAIFMTTPGGVVSYALQNVMTPRPSAGRPVGPAAHHPIAKIYDSPVEPVIRDDAA